MERIIKAIKQFRLKDLLAPFIFLVILMPSLIFRFINALRHRKLWLVAEQGEARDNGYYFYKYVREKHPKDYCFYAVKLDSPGYDRVKELGNVIKYGSLKHWLYYMSANLNISSQKSGNPCPIFWYVIHVTFGLYKNRVFLQHGITMNNAKYIYRRYCKFKFFICGAEAEFNYILNNFGYNKKELLLTGFPRWDSLKNTNAGNKKKTILIMPTWRQWLGGEKNVLFEIKDFKESNFYRYWNGLLNNAEFIKFIESNDIEVYFYPHINMHSFIDTFNYASDNIIEVLLDQDLQGFLNSCDLMITDYSSVMFDFAYLKKPIIYYQFDELEFRRRQYSGGYFDCASDGFGPVVKNEEALLKAIKDCVKDKFEVRPEFLKKEKDFFIFHDHDNNKRVYEAIK